MKGFVYFAEAARALSGRKFRFVAAGMSAMSDEFMAKYTDYIDFVGHVSQGRMAELYSASSVLVFPTLCDGFGSVQLEAMSRGVPVLATKNCGEVVQDGYNGFLLDLRSTESIVSRLERIQEDVGLWKQLSLGAQMTAQYFNEARYENELLSQNVIDV